MRFVFLAVLAAASAAAAQQQCSSPGWLEIKDQAGVQKLQGCTAFEGSIMLSGSVSDLSGLSSLQSVSLSLNIEGTKLTTLNGLDALKSVKDKLYVKGNPSLRSLAGLGGLTEVGHGLFVEYNNVLSDISALANLKVVNANPNMFGNASAESYFGLHVRGNPKLASLAGLQSATPGGEIVLEDLPLVTDLTGLPAPASGPIRKLVLQKMNGLTTLDTLPAYQGLSGMALIVSDCSSLTSLEAPFAVPAAPAIVKVTGNDKLSDVGALAAVKTWPEGVNISGNPQLCDFKGINTTILAAQPNAVVTPNCFVKKSTAAGTQTRSVIGAAAAVMTSITFAAFLA